MIDLPGEIAVIFETLEKIIIDFSDLNTLADAAPNVESKGIILFLKRT